VTLFVAANKAQIVAAVLAQTEPVTVTEALAQVRRFHEAHHASPADQFANELYESSGRDLAPIPRP